MSQPRKHTTPPPADPSDPLFSPAMSPETNAAANALSTAISGAVAPAGEPFIGEAKTSIARRGFEEVEKSSESTAVGAQIKAEIAARTITAMQHPRSFDDARIAILKDCERPAFAKAAIYRKPVGGSSIEGLSIRFAESALRHWTNIASQAVILYDGPDKRVVRIALTDLESNVTHGRDVVLLKTVERRSVRPGQVVVSQRVNTGGDIVYEVMATEDELATKEAAARSKVMRNEGLRLLPADILDEAMAKCRRTRAADDAKDPDAAKKAVADAFADLGILPSNLEDFLGCTLSQASPSQVSELREWFVAVRDGDATWAEIVAAKVSDLGGEKEEATKVPALLERAKQKAAERKAAKG